VGFRAAQNCATMGLGASSEISGVRVFKVHPASPAAESGLEIFFDFIVQVNGTSMDAEGQASFAEKIKESENGVATLQVYNARTHAVREVSVRPRQWGGSGLLGASVRFDTADPAECNGIRVLEVFPGSPAAHAGLIPFQDFILGSATTAFHDIAELVESVDSSINQRMQIHVYNSDSETIREVTLVPNNDWGGEGCIGCDIRAGLFHRIPPPRPQRSRNVTAPGVVPRAPGAPVPPPPIVPGGCSGYPSTVPTSLSGVPQVPSGVAPPAGVCAPPYTPGTYQVAAPPAAAQPSVMPVTPGLSPALEQRLAAVGMAPAGAVAVPPAAPGVFLPTAPGGPPHYQPGLNVADLFQTSTDSGIQSPDSLVPPPVPPSTPMHSEFQAQTNFITNLDQASEKLARLSEHEAVAET